MGCRLLASPWGPPDPIGRDGAVSAPHKDLPLLPAFPRCTLCTTRPQQLDADTCPAYGRVLQIGTHIFLALPLSQLQSEAALRFLHYISSSWRKGALRLGDGTDEVRALGCEWSAVTATWSSPKSSPGYSDVASLQRLSKPTASGAYSHRQRWITRADSRPVTRHHFD